MTNEEMIEMLDVIKLKSIDLINDNNRRGNEIATLRIEQSEEDLILSALLTISKITGAPFEDLVFSLTGLAWGEEQAGEIIYNHDHI